MTVAAPAPPGPSGAAGAVRHLYVHLPFCVHRCGYCDFVTVVGRRDEHAGYVDALLAELAAALREAGVSRVSLGAQTFQPRLLEVLERTATPEDVRAAVGHLRAAGFDNISLDLIYGIPGQSPDDLAADLAEAVALGPEHLSCYELEAKPGTRFTVHHGAELERQADALEGYFETVAGTLEAAGYLWYETANFCRPGGERDLRAQHNLGYWLARDYLGIGIGAVSTVAGQRWKNAPKLPAYREALGRGELPLREVEPLDEATRAVERVMLGLRLAEGIALDDQVAAALDGAALLRFRALGLLEPAAGDGRLRLTRRGRFVGGGVTAELLA